MAGRGKGYKSQAKKKKQKETHTVKGNHKRVIQKAARHQGDKISSWNPGKSPAYQNKKPMFCSRTQEKTRVSIKYYLCLGFIQKLLDSQRKRKV